MNIHDLLQTMADRKLTLGTVESMTGGDFASAITAIPGASHVYKGGIVAYSKEVKSNVVGVDPAICIASCFEAPTSSVDTSSLKQSSTPARSRPAAR